MSFESHLILLLISTGINRDIITATAVIAGISSFAFGFFTNLPVALA
jgi:xanthine/uracil/vitamin C permease (AzgA family)